MKHIVILFLAVLTFAPIYGQEENMNINEIFLFEYFENGVVHFKSGHTAKAKLNYGTVRQQMYFKDKESSILVLANVSDILTVNIGDRVFEHWKRGQFYEKIPTGNGFMYIDWKIKIISAKVGAYGGEDHTSAITNLGSFIGKDNQLNALNINENVKTISSNRYYVKVKGKLKEFSNFKGLAKIFKFDNNKMNEFVEKEKLNFTKVDDIKKGVAYVLNSISAE